jgi:hypothetical protein
MLQGSELALDRATIERSVNREMAIMAKASLSGYKFIRLRLKNIRRRKISGIDAITATEFQNDEMGGITDYYIEVRGGEIDFKYRPELGMHVFDMLDTDRNREFLASHYGGDYWEIMDKTVEADVTKRAEAIAARIRNAPVTSDAPKEFWQEVRASEEQALRAARGDVDIPPSPMTPLQEKKAALWKNIQKHDRAEPNAETQLNVPHETLKPPIRPGAGVVAP